MNRYHIYLPRKTAALNAAVHTLARSGLSFAETPEEANILLLPVPTPKDLCPPVQPGQLVIGGAIENGLDLLKDPVYLAENAAITAEAALGILLSTLPCSLRGCRILLLGWGRIGACLGKMLTSLGAAVTVYDRKPEKCALLRALGYPVCGEIPASESFRAVINTIPAEIFPASAVFPPDCIRLDLASGIFLPGDGVVSALGLPGKYRPEASGRLIADRVLAFLKGGTFL